MESFSKSQSCQMWQFWTGSHSIFGNFNLRYANVGCKFLPHLVEIRLADTYQYWSLIIPEFLTTCVYKMQYITIHIVLRYPHLLHITEA